MNEARSLARSSGLILELHRNTGDEFLLRMMMAFRVTKTAVADLYRLHELCGFDVKETKRELERWLSESPDSLSKWLSEIREIR